MLTNCVSDLTQSPVRSSEPTAAPRRSSRSRWAVRSASGPINSPKSAASSTNTAPMRASVPAACSGENPETRITVYSLFAARVASATSVPMSTAIGNSS